MACTNLAVFGSAFFTPILVGKITHTIYWWWTFYFIAIFCAASLVALILFVPETAFRRDAAPNVDMTAAAGSSPYPDGAPTTYRRESDRSGGGDSGTHDSPASDAPLKLEDGSARRPPPRRGLHMPPKKTYLQSLMPFDGRKTDEDFVKLLFRPFPLFAQPAFLWACLIQGTMIGWTVFIGVILAAIFLGPPLFWDEVSTGYAYIGPFVGALLGFAIAGGLSDWSARLLTRRNGGIYEPEFRILLVVPQLVIGCMGLYGFAITAQGALASQYHFVVPILFFGLVVCGMVVGAVASSLYIVDAYRE